MPRRHCLDTVCIPGVSTGHVGTASGDTETDLEANLLIMMRYYTGQCVACAVRTVLSRPLECCPSGPFLNRAPRTKPTSPTPQSKIKAPSTILALASLTVSVNAHGYISKPKATYEPNTVYTTYNALTTASINSAFAGGKFDGSPSQNTQVFNERWNATGYKSLRDMVDPFAPDYGHSIKTATPVDVTGYTEMWWQNDEYKECFIASREGPCEAWIDDIRIFHHDDCAAQFKTYPAKIPADYSSCKGDCLFSFYWLTLHEPNWQIYKQCVPITNNGSGATTQASGSDETTTTDAPVVTPAATTTAPVATKGPVAPASTPIPEATVTTPQATKGATVPAATPAPEVTTTTPETPTTDAPVESEAPTTDSPEETETPDETEAPTTSSPAKQDNCKM